VVGAWGVGPERDDEYAPLATGWRLQRDFAVRSAGFPVSGLEVFGPGDETERLRSVARHARFREAVTWQNPAALVNAVVNVAENAPTKPSRARGREEIVASYWQRYCAKNDTIGFFGPLAWGRIADDGPGLGSRSGSLVRERAVHLEAWPVQELAATLDPQLKVACGAGRGVRGVDRSRAGAQRGPRLRRPDAVLHRLHARSRRDDRTSAA